MKAWQKKLIIFFISFTAILAIFFTPPILIESGKFQSDKNLNFQKNLIKSLNDQMIVNASDFLDSQNLTHEFICINGAYLSPNEVLSWQKDKFHFTELELQNITNIGYENYWSISIFDTSGQGELISIYSPTILISPSTELNLDASCFESKKLMFRKYNKLNGKQTNTLDLIIN